MQTNSEQELRVSNPVSVQPVAAASSIPSAPVMTMMPTADLQAGLERLAANRRVIEEFVKSQLKEGVDYGQAFKGVSKPTLLKPGQEKIYSLFGISSTCEKDDVTLSMFSNTPGLVAYIVKMYKDGQLLGEGRGAAKLGDKSRDENATIKIAQKRARMDAALTLGFSDFFTQDMEDADYQPDTSRPVYSRPNAPVPVAARAAQAGQEGQVMDVSILVASIAMKTAKSSGNTYAELITSTGKRVMAWHNTCKLFEVGKTYKVSLEEGGQGRDGMATYSVKKVYPDNDTQHNAWYIRHHGFNDRRLFDVPD